MVARTERGIVADWMRTVDPWLLGAFLGLMAIGVVMALAASPAVAEHIGLHCNRGIVVNDTMQTITDGRIYAVGECAAHRGITQNRTG